MHCQIVKVATGDYAGGEFVQKLEPGYFYGIDWSLNTGHNIIAANDYSICVVRLINQKDNTDYNSAIFTCGSWILGKTDTFLGGVCKNSPILPVPIFLQNPYIHIYNNGSAGMTCTIFYEKTLKRYEK